VPLLDQGSLVDVQFDTQNLSSETRTRSFCPLHEHTTQTDDPAGRLLNRGHGMSPKSPTAISSDSAHYRRVGDHYRPPVLGESFLLASTEVLGRRTRSLVLQADFGASGAG
jgi:hypothetical protein